MNTVNLIGRLTAKPELKTGAQTSYCHFTVAVDGMKDHTDFIRIKSFGKTAELVAQYMDRGRQVGITGHITTGKREKDGGIEYFTDVVADRVDFIGKAEKKLEEPSGFTELPDDDMPF